MSKHIDICIEHSLWISGSIREQTLMFGFIHIVNWTSIIPSAFQSSIEHEENLCIQLCGRIKQRLQMSALYFSMLLSGP